VGVTKAGADSSVPQPEQGRVSTVIETEATHTIRGQSQTLVSGVSLREIETSEDGT